MAGRGSGEGYCSGIGVGSVVGFASGDRVARGVDVDGFTPIEFGDLFGGDAPEFEVCADAEGGVEVAGPGGELLNRLIIEMVVVIVGEEDGFERGWHVGGLIDIRTRISPGEKAEGRGITAEDRVDEDMGGAQLEQVGRVTEPDDGGLAGRQAGQVGADRREGLRRRAIGGAIAIFLQHLPDGSILEGDFGGDRVLEAAVAVVRGAEDALEARTGGAFTEGS